MSTVPEVHSRTLHGLSCVAVSVVTNFAAGLAGGDPSHEETQEYRRAEAAESFSSLLRAFIARYRADRADAAAGNHPRQARRAAR